MTLFRKTTRFYSDEYEMRGAVTAFNNKIAMEDLGGALPYYIGAAMVLNILLNHDEIRDQSVLMDFFEMQLQDQEII